MTASWIEVKCGKWRLRSEVVGFQPVSGDHSGWNLGRYIVGLCDRVGILNNNGSKVRYSLVISINDSLLTQQLFTITLDNTSNNNTTCEAVETFHTRRRYDDWNAKENQLP
jgi:hypothetical protein